MNCTLDVDYPPSRNENVRLMIAIPDWSKHVISRWSPERENIVKLAKEDILKVVVFTLKS